MDVGNSHSGVFALLIPTSAAARETTKVRCNLRLVGWESSIVPHAKSTLPKIRVIKLDFPFLLGRRCLTFGSSRSSDYRLPEFDDVEPQQFILFFSAEDRALHFKDTSLSGTQIFTAIHGSSLEQDVGLSSLPPRRFIQFGKQGRFTFELVLSPATSELEDNLTTYFKSIQHTPSATTTPCLRSVCLSRKRSAEIPVDVETTKKRPRLDKPPMVIATSPSTPQLRIETSNGPRLQRAMGFQGQPKGWIQTASYFMKRLMG
jgi:hypothetical protein